MTTSSSYEGNEKVIICDLGEDKRLVPYADKGAHVRYLSARKGRTMAAPGIPNSVNNFRECSDLARAWQHGFGSWRSVSGTKS